MTSASADEPAAQGTEPLLAVADGHTLRRSFGDQTAALYGQGGRPFATGTQVAYFRYSTSLKTSRRSRRSR